MGLNRRKRHTPKPAKAKEAPGLEYERIVAAIYRQFSEIATVTENAQIRGRSGELRQIDVALRTSVVGSELLVIIECKDYRRPVSQGKVDEVIGKLEDVGAARAVLVSDSGFSKGAVRRAHADGRVQLVSVIDTQNAKLRSALYRSIYVEFHELLYPFDVKFELVPKHHQEPAVTPAGPNTIRLHEAIRKNIVAVVQQFFEWCQHECGELPAGVHTYRQGVVVDTDHELVATITFEKRVRAFFSKDVYCHGRGVFDHASKRVLATDTLHHVRIEEEEVVATWQPVGADFAAPAESLQYRRLSWYNLDSAVDVASGLLSKLIPPPA